MTRILFPRRNIFLIAAALSSSLLYYYSTGVTGFRPLVWIAPVPVLAYSLIAARKPALIIAFIVYFMGCLNLYSYLSRVTPIPVILISFTLLSGVFTLAVEGFRYAAAKYNNILPAIFFAASWTSWEYLLSIVSPHGTAFSISYTQSDFIPFIQLASLTGIWGLTFILMLVPASIVLAWHHRSDSMKIILMLLIPLLLVFIVFTTGYMRIHRPFDKIQFPVGLAASDTSVRYFDAEKREEAIAVLKAFDKRIGLLAAQGAGIIVLPEKFVGVTNEYYLEVERNLQQCARKNQVLIVAGLNLIGSGNNRNSAIVISPEGKILCDYDKVYFIPGAEEGYRRGTKPGIFKREETTFGVQICKDMDFPGWSRKYGKSDCGIMLVPAWDFTVDAWLHSRMAVMRAVENGFSMVRCAQQGYLTINDFRGKILAENSTAGKPDALLTGNVYPGPGHTFYTYAGDWFAFLNVIIVIFCLVMIRIRSIINEK